MHINLLILKTQQLERLKEFYEKLGLTFAKEKHGGPEHYSCRLGNLVLELYSTLREPTLSSFGIATNQFDASIELLRTYGAIYKLPYQTPYGRQAIVTDPDGRHVFLSEYES